MKVIAPPLAEADVLAPVNESADSQDVLEIVRQWGDQCVVHLCGCNCGC